MACIRDVDVGVGSGNLLGIFTKESAALTPVFALVISILFLDRTPAGSVQRILRNSVLVTAFAILLYYLSPWYRDWFHVVDYRGWSPWERLQTQSVILWHYLRLAAFPLPTAFSPFGDAYPNHTGTPIVWIATSAWIILIASVIWLYKVKKLSGQSLLSLGFSRATSWSRPRSHWNCVLNTAIISPCMAWP